jgi:hypothetical protein
MRGSATSAWRAPSRRTRPRTPAAARSGVLPLPSPRSAPSCSRWCAAAARAATSSSWTLDWVWRLHRDYRARLCASSTRTRPSSCSCWAWSAATRAPPKTALSQVSLSSASTWSGNFMRASLGHVFSSGICNNNIA